MEFGVVALARVMPLSPVQPPMDFVLVTALEEERKALLGRLPDCRPLPPEPNDIRHYFAGHLPVTLPGGAEGQYRVVVMQLLGMGRVQAATATGDAIRRWRPRFVIMVGIAGGVAAKEVGLGDILVSQQVVDYELQKLTDDGPQIRWQVFQADPRLLGACQQLAAENVAPRLEVRRPVKGVPRRQVGPVASGDKVVAFAAGLDRYRENWSALIGVEMEGAGVAAAAFQAAKPPGFFMVRGVSDLADARKDSAPVRKWRAYACEVAAWYTVALLRSGPVPLGRGPGAAAPRRGRASAGGVSAADDARRAYLRNLRRQCLALPLTALGDDDAEMAVTLDDVYIDLETTTRVKSAAKGKRGPKPRRGLGPEGGEDTRALTAIEAASRASRLVLLGAPGAGKSTFVQRLLAGFASRQLGEGKTPLRGVPTDLLPVLVVLRDLTPRLAGLAIDDWTETERRQRLSALIQDQAVSNLTSLQAEAFGPEFRAILDSGRVLLVLDGLDEVPQREQRAFRLVVGAALVHFRPERVIVTCRIRSYEGEARLPGFEVHTIAPFTEDQIRQFVRGWYGAQERSGRLGKSAVVEKAEDLIEAALGRDLRELSENPMLLTTMALIHQRETRLPSQRVCLYTLAVDVLMRRWQKGKTGKIAAFLNDPIRVRASLEHLAHRAHETGAGDAATADLSRADALAILEASDHLGGAGLASDFLDHVDQRAGLLIGRGGEPGRPQVYSFPHRTFQEYLAGCHLLGGRDGGAVARAVRAKAVEGETWSLAVKLAAEELSHNVRDGRLRLLDLAYQLCPCLPPSSTEDRRAELWSGYAAALLDIDFIRRDREVRDGGERYLNRLVPRLVALLTIDLTAPERAEAGRILASFGDPRPGVGLTTEGLPDVDWIELPAGPFHPREEAGEQVLEPFRIGRYPVTVRQFDAFVRAGGYGEKRFWTEEGWRWRKRAKVEGPSDFGPRFRIDNHPQVGVSWYEARAFCEWLSERTGHAIRLAHEFEWERAAGHTDGRTYPWGNEEELSVRCNMGGTGIGSTCAVGLFPNGLSECGAADMAGNVWEWCEDLARSDQPWRVLRGGSWVYDFPTRLSCSCRTYGRPEFRGLNVGFRCIWVGGSVRSVAPTT